MTLDLICAVNTKLNGLQMQVGQYGIYQENQDKILINHERRLKKTEKSVDLLQWGHNIQYLNLDGKDYMELNQHQKLACLARDFFRKAM